MKDADITETLLSLEKTKNGILRTAIEMGISTCKHEAKRSSQNGWYRQSISLSECARVMSEALEQVRAEVSK